MSKIIKVDHGTFPFQILVCIGLTHEEVVEWLKFNKYELTEESKELLRKEGEGRTVMLEKGVTVMQLDDIKDKAEFYAVLSHEVFHAVEFLFDRIGIKHDIDISGELFAYQIGYVTKHIIRNLKK